ncbi:10117_t:CDS:10 [Ambispora leptoticha]|uniref:CTP synthase n=1 Tax=Ambispora leptoticha TaxID=144679 RepID=A0A9N9A6T1_9GLOM|nr:10117_t:CDS:10 [Ambispora leptoticha]
MKYVLILGGVISGIGKGVIASSTGLLLKTLGLKVTAIKIDPYINVDAGTMNPIEHGEIFVLNDGAEVDLDLGNYERFLDITLTRDNNITSGKIFQTVIEKERRGDYLGQNVQSVPHVTDAIQNWIERVAKIPVDQSSQEPDICIIELGGTIGDFESAPYIEALRQFQYRVGRENFAVIQVSLVPVLGVVGEQKTKPTQATVRQLRALGLKPDLIACRCAQALESRVKAKISTYCRVDLEQVLSVQDVSSTYKVPLLLKEQGTLNYLRKRLQLDKLCISPKNCESGEALFRDWKTLTETHASLKKTVTIALVGKYTYLQDSYLSVTQALEHASIACERKLIIKWIEATDLELETKENDPGKYREAWDNIFAAEGILVPGGFGHRGTEGKIAAAKWARENKVPYLGICLGLQIAVIEFARDVCGLIGKFQIDNDDAVPQSTIGICPKSKYANSEELDPETDHKVIVYMPEVSRTHLGGTMRLGLRPTKFQDGSESWSKICEYSILNIRLVIIEFHGLDIDNFISSLDKYYESDERTLVTARKFLDIQKENRINGTTENGMKLTETSTIRLGKSNTKITSNGFRVLENSLKGMESVRSSKTLIEERHRHRYEVNPVIVERLETQGLMFVGRDETGDRMEILELKDHPFFVATQYHPEYLSRPLKPVPTFFGFIQASAGMMPLRKINGINKHLSNTNSHTHTKT